NKRVVGMEDYVAADERPLAKCLKDVEASDVYVGVFAYRYGFIPEPSEIPGTSITELEYRHALKCKKPCLLFLLAEDQPWQRSFMDDVTGEGDEGKRIARLREDLVKEKLASYFKTQQELAGLVIAALAVLDQSSSVPVANPGRRPQDRRQ